MNWSGPSKLRTQLATGQASCCESSTVTLGRMFDRGRLRRRYENELHERLRDIYLSSEVRTYWNAQNPKYPLSPNPTIGSYLKLLESDLPADVISKIEAAGVMLRGKPDLLRGLKVLKARRDQGAHTSREVTTGDPHRQRDAIFYEQLPRDFLSALSPRAAV